MEGVAAGEQARDEAATTDAQSGDQSEVAESETVASESETPQPEVQRPSLESETNADSVALIRSDSGNRLSLPIPVGVSFVILATGIVLILEIIAVASNFWYEIRTAPSASEPPVIPHTQIVHGTFVGPTLPTRILFAAATLCSFSTMMVLLSPSCLKNYEPFRVLFLAFLSNTASWSLAITAIILAAIQKPSDYNPSWAFYLALASHAVNFITLMVLSAYTNESRHIGRVFVQRGRQ